jgi:predicted TIM-barrel fold metal-dependent hydrolase
MNTPKHESNFSRRNFLGGLAAIGTSALVSASSGLAQAQGNPRRVDFHHHFQTPGVVDLAKSRGLNFNSPWTLSRDLEDMEKNGTATALLSAMGQPGNLNFGDIELARKATRMANDYAAKLNADYPGRFGSFAALPLWFPDNDGCLREVAYALDTLKADGFAMYTSHNDRYVGDAYWNPLYEELNRRRAVVFVHPHAPECCSQLATSLDVAATIVEYGADTTRTIARVVFSGLSKRFPNITWVFSHSGGMMPFVIERFFGGGLSAEIVPGITTKGQDGRPRPEVPTGNDVLRELRKFYYDTAQSSNPVAQGALRQVVGVTQIVYGTDYWFRTAAETGRGLETNKVYTAEEQRAINRGNAERILPRLRS